MTDIFGRLSADEILPIVIVTIIFGSAVTIILSSVIAHCVYKIRRDSTAAQLKHDMLDRGMTAEEIKMVLEAGPKA